MNSIIAIYPAHDSSIATYVNGQYRIFELERLKKERFYRFDNQDDYKETYDQMKKIIKKECGVDSFDICLQLCLPEAHQKYLTDIFQIKEFIFCGHHISHAACSFYQSDFDKALICSYDGGGLDQLELDKDDRVTFFNIYLADRQEGLTKLHTAKLDLGTAYGMMALPISEVTKTEEDWGQKFLSFSGKLMAISSMGKIIKNRKHCIKKFFTTPKHLDLSYDFRELLGELELPGIINSVSKNAAWNLAATAQKVFEEVAWETIEPFVKEYKDLPICLSGGCALNIIFNQKLVDTLSVPVFIPPNPSDCGLAFGMLANYLKPKEAVNIMYAGFPILDKIDTTYHIKPTKPSLHEIARYLADGKIIGIVRGNSECGPRALGNRSILCDPSFPKMKDILNAKVKQRENYRPFGPICKLEDVNKYFEFDNESRFMSFSPKVRSKYLNKIASAVHIDGTSRVQTVRKEDNEFIYNLLTEFEKIKGQGLLLNTSFNIKGLPILTSCKDALDVLDNTELDGVLIEDKLFMKE